MEQHLNFVTLAVADVERSRAFYAQGLGWQVAFEAPGEVAFLPVADGVMLSLWSREGFAGEVGAQPAEGVAPLTLAHNVATTGEVDAVLATARAAGARVQDPEHRDWGGYSGYFIDPDGFRWEVALNPTPLGEQLVAATGAWARRRVLTVEAVLAELGPREPVFHREPADADLAHFRAMTTDDFVEVGASGAVYDREQICAVMAQRAASGDRGGDDAWQVHDLVARELAGGVWQLAYGLDQAGRRTRRTTTWVLDAGGWRVAHHQGTPCA